MFFVNEFVIISPHLRFVVITHYFDKGCVNYKLTADLPLNNLQKREHIHCIALHFCFKHSLNEKSIETHMQNMYRIIAYRLHQYKINGLLGSHSKGL